ncbi:fructosamine kinase family protein [Streptomyces sp. NEAU-W12]|uniref:fructosamine kinase family protein n=1 Tax=Streptomyces sp. NEAU-W12 TaxID=2994668 RepID=UPI00224A72F9|nr:fructosamine kinase family protein [Streptomyces sp. NEAU-W12]MCX2926051.1 fructosamine kinase family protein [Streptomyces sp. NEAU-W12]
MSHEELLADRLREAGYAAKHVERATGGVVAIAGLVTLQDDSRLFAKTLLGPDLDIFPVESAGLSELRDPGGANTPDVLFASPQLLVLERMQPRRDDENFWEQLAHMVASLHMSTVSDRFGWHRDGWLGRLRQDNTWETDGHVFFAERRVLRWLPEPLVEAAFDREERRALERLCAALPELVPPQPPCLTHGDLWQENIVATGDGAPVLIDPAVSYSWPEADLSMLWCSPRASASERFFAAYQDIAGLQEGWQERMPLLHLRELLSIIAHDDDDWGAAEAVRKIIAPFRRGGGTAQGASGVPV